MLRDELGFAALGLISLQKDVGNRNQGDFQDGKGKPYPRERAKIKDLNYLEIKILRQAKDMLMKQLRHNFIVNIISATGLIKLGAFLSLFSSL